MKHKLTRFSIFLIIPLIVYFAWRVTVSSDEPSRIGYYGIVAAFIVSLFPAVDAIFGQKENPNELLYKVQQLTKPLQDITANLVYGGGQIPEAANIFQREIEQKGLSLMLERDSPALAESLGQLKRVAFESLGVKPSETIGLLMALSKDITAQRDRLQSDENATQLVGKIKRQIEELLAKYGGSD